MRVHVLSLFPGIDLFGRAFESLGFNVYRGPDPLWGGDVRAFDPVPGAFDGIIGGPPCQRFSPLANVVRARYGEEALAPDLVPEFERCVDQAGPRWFVMEEVERAPVPCSPGYATRSLVVNAWEFGNAQNRVRRITVGVSASFFYSAHDEADRWLERLEREKVPLALRLRMAPAATSSAGGRRAVAVRVGAKGMQGGPVGLVQGTPRELARLQGFDESLVDDLPFRAREAAKAIANGVPRELGAAIARTVPGRTP